MAELLLSISGLAGVLIGYVLFRPRRTRPPHFHPIANASPPDLPSLAPCGVTSAEALEWAARRATSIREAMN